MDAPPQFTSRTTVYSLWHIPSSTLFVTTSDRREIERRVGRAMADGVPVDELMLQVTPKGELIGRQHLGARIQEALRDLLTPTDISLESA